jgi:hypothetical protein
MYQDPVSLLVLIQLAFEQALLENLKTHFP